MFERLLPVGGRGREGGRENWMYRRQTVVVSGGQREKFTRSPPLFFRCWVGSPFSPSTFGLFTPIGMHHDTCCVASGKERVLKLCSLSQGSGSFFPSPLAIVDPRGYLRQSSQIPGNVRWRTVPSYCSPDRRELRGDTKPLRVFPALAGGQLYCVRPAPCPMPAPHVPSRDGYFSEQTVYHMMMEQLRYARLFLHSSMGLQNRNEYQLNPYGVALRWLCMRF
ncbi:uncharacterized protein BDCG_07781 [Blastomyces dermatitidis ER-3]|uniref:Uncharacterized protein n=1 Tax=Ajellomyces dermatitidis (strain ER-3 / ATCC MYA-2586) TaxID=559297 RepID=A0ABP2F6B9_AJEDR|nr:uncharacterized protein BDCG_07781 [Blastomyces dermatitidis ER-3]EEQ92661.2 hypothetical protein BDCG_07781 [Blastomyces dermatitidis ER-3]